MLLAFACNTYYLKYLREFATHSDYELLSYLRVDQSKDNQKNYDYFKSRMIYFENDIFGSFYDKNRNP